MFLCRCFFVFFLSSIIKLMNTRTIIIANTMVSIGELIMLYGSTKKDKRKVLIIQIISILFMIFSNLLLKGYSGVVVNILAIVRNLVTLSGHGSRRMSLLFVGLCVVLGISFNNRGLLGYLPILANISQTAVISSGKASTRQIHFVLSFSCFCWLIFDLMIQSYAGALLDLINSVSYLFHGLTTAKENQ